MLRWLKSDPDSGDYPRDAPLRSIRFVVLDTELTSLDAKRNRLLSVGAIAMAGGRIHVGEQFYRVVNPGVAVPSESVKVHKLRPSDIEAGETPDAVLKDLQKFIEGAVLVLHFAEIDLKILRKEMAQFALELKPPAVCTARVHRWLVQRQRYSEDQYQKLEASDLSSLAHHYKLGVHEAHHALDDAFVTARLWQKQLHEIGKHGIETFGQLMKIGGV